MLGWFFFFLERNDYCTFIWHICFVPSFTVAETLALLSLHLHFAAQFKFFVIIIIITLWWVVTCGAIL